MKWNSDQYEYVRGGERLGLAEEDSRKYNCVPKAVLRKH
jgi:hypothetical protein